MVYAIWIVLGILSLMDKKSKAIALLLYLYTISLFCLNTAAPDLNSYIYQYEGYGIFFTEPIFVGLGQLFRNYGFSYYLYRSFISIVSISIIYMLVFDLSPLPNLVLFLYTIYPLTIDIVQIRFTAAYALAFLSIWFLIQYQINKRHRYLIAYFLLIITASCFHYSAILYGIVSLIILDVRRHRLLYLYVIPIFVILGLVFLDRLSPLVSQIIGTAKTENWLEREQHRSLMSSLLIAICRGLPLLFVLILKRRCEVNKKSADNSYYDYDRQTIINQTLLTCAYYIYLLVILEISIAGDYERLQRLDIILCVILATRYISLIQPGYRYFYVLLMLIIHILYFSSIMFVKGNYEGQKYYEYVFRQVMESNSLYGETYWRY